MTASHAINFYRQTNSMLFGFCIFLQKSNFQNCPRLLRCHHRIKRSYRSTGPMSSSKSENTQGYQVASSAGFGFPADLVVDLRSDTLTLPSQGMRQAIANATLGDDVFGEDPTTNEFEKRVAELLGKEAALLVCSGTQGNLISALVHCNARGSELICGDESHVFRYEQGNISQFGGIHSCQLPNNVDGTFNIDTLKERIRSDDIHYPITKLVCIENTHNRMGGRALPQDWIDELAQVCHERQIPIHMDGARLFNAVITTGLPAKRIVRDMASVSICFSKGLGSPAGSAIAGTRAFVEQARRMRKALGGGMRQNGILAACGLYCLDYMIDRLKDDHDNAKLIKEIVNSKQLDTVHFDAESLDSNIVILNVKGCSVQDFCAKLATVENEEEERARLEGKSVSVKCFPVSNDTIRLVTHCDITREMAKFAALKVCYVGEEISR